MSREINKLFTSFDELRKLLYASIDKAGESSELAEELSGDFDQEISTDLEALQMKLSSILEELDVTYDEARVLWDDERQLEKGLRSEPDDEDNPKTKLGQIREAVEEEKDQA